MNKILIKFLIFFFLLTNQSISEENIMILKLKGDIRKFATKSTIKLLKEKYE